MTGHPGISVMLSRTIQAEKIRQIEHDRLVRLALQEPAAEKQVSERRRLVRIPRFRHVVA